MPGLNYIYNTSILHIDFWSLEKLRFLNSVKVTSLRLATYILELCSRMVSSVLFTVVLPILFLRPVEAVKLLWLIDDSLFVC